MPLDADSRMVLIQVKVERAMKHLDDFKTELITYRGKQLQVVGTHRNPQTGEAFQGLAPLPLLPFNVISCAGDVVQNLRSALDHLAHQLAEVGTPGVEPSIYVAFPIAASAEIYEAQKIRKVQGMRPEAIKAIDALKPYKGGNEPLWRLHELNNIDKHRLLFTVSTDHLFIGSWFGDAAYWHKTGNPHFSGIFEPKVDDDVQLAKEKAVGESQIIWSNALLPFLQQLVDYVYTLIMSFGRYLE